jgi:8-oxo-dGTP diphosphatase
MTSASNQSKITYQEDKYGGIILDDAAFKLTPAVFEKELAKLIADHTDKKLIWITLPIAKSEYIPLLTQQNFTFYDCSETTLILVKKVIPNPIIPNPTNHTIGVGVFVRDGDNMLVVKDRIYRSYKLPGGYMDNEENISQAVAREVAEETGIRVQMDAVVSIGHFTPCQFNESNIYLVCKATPLSTTIEIGDTEEIIEARWMNIDQYIKHEHVHPYNKKIVMVALHNRGIKHEACDLFIPGEKRYEFFF